MLFVAQLSVLCPSLIFFFFCISSPQFNYRDLNTSLSLSPWQLQYFPDK
jgi:hypothetical protein